MKIRISDGVAGIVGLVLSIPAGIWMLNIKVPIHWLWLLWLCYILAIIIFVLSGLWLTSCFEDDSFNDTLWTISLPEGEDEAEKLEAIREDAFNEQILSYQRVMDYCNNSSPAISVKPIFATGVWYHCVNGVAVAPNASVKPTSLTAEQVKAYIRSKDIYGLISWREWKYADQFLWGIGNGEGYRWQSINQNDITPSEANGNGFYSRTDKATAITLYGTPCCGLIESRGGILVHSDNVVRSEWARILFVYCSTGGNDIDTLQHNYPDVMVTTPDHYDLIMQCLEEEGLI